MSALKRKNGKLLVKNGKLSCSCCEDCCMYPADGLGDTYDEDDLPDTLTLTIHETEIPMVKDEDGLYEPDPVFTLPSELSSVMIDPFAPSRILLQWVYDVDFLNVFTATLACLIGQGDAVDSEDNTQPYVIEDQFEASYELDAYNFVDQEWVNYTLTRVSLCDWEFEDKTLYYTNILGVPTWVFDDGDVAHGKEGDQNTPVGDYQDSGELEQITISIL